MQFKFKIQEIWENERIGVYHLIGSLIDGSILPDSQAIIEERPDVKILIKSVSLVSYTDGKTNPNEFTLSIDKPNLSLHEVKGMTLRNA